MYPSPGSVHCGSCVFLGGPGVSDRVSPGPVSFPIARAVTVSVRLCLARFLLFLLCAFIHVLFAPACLVRPPKPCRAIRVSGACRACRLARQPEIGHPCRPASVLDTSRAYSRERFWRKKHRNQAMLFFLYRAQNRTRIIVYNQLICRILRIRYLALFDINRSAQEMRLLANEKIQKHFTPCETFPNAGS